MMINLFVLIIVLVLEFKKILVNAQYCYSIQTLFIILTYVFWLNLSNPITFVYFLVQIISSLFFDLTSFIWIIWFGLNYSFLCLPYKMVK